MGKNFLAKFRIFILSIGILFLLVAFQNCGKAHSLLVTKGSLMAPGEPTDTTPSSTPNPEPDPIADIPPDDGGGTNPAFKLDRSLPDSNVPDCFVIAVVGINPAVPEELILHVRLLNENLGAVSADAGKLLILGSASTAEIEASSVNRESGILEFHATENLLNSGGLSGVFAGSGYNVVVSQCAASN